MGQLTGVATLSGRRCCRGLPATKAEQLPTERPAMTEESIVPSLYGPERQENDLSQNSMVTQAWPPRETSTSATQKRCETFEDSYRELRLPS